MKMLLILPQQQPIKVEMILINVQAMLIMELMYLVLYLYLLNKECMLPSNTVVGQNIEQHVVEFMFILIWKDGLNDNLFLIRFIYIFFLRYIICIILTINLQKKISKHSKFFYKIMVAHFHKSIKHCSNFVIKCLII